MSCCPCAQTVSHDRGKRTINLTASWNKLDCHQFTISVFCQHARSKAARSQLLDLQEIQHGALPRSTNVLMTVHFTCSVSYIFRRRPLNGHGSGNGERRGCSTSTDKNQQRTTLCNATQASTGNTRVGQAPSGSVRRNSERWPLYKGYTVGMHRLQQRQEESQSN